MAGNSQRRGAMRKPGTKKGPARQASSSDPRNTLKLRELRGSWFLKS